MRHLETIVWGFGQFIIECIRNLAFIFGGRASSSISSNASVRCGLFCLRLTKKSHFGGWLISSIIPHGSLYIYNVTFFFFTEMTVFKRRCSFWCRTRFLQLETSRFQISSHEWNSNIKTSQFVAIVTLVSHCNSLLHSELYTWHLW